MFDKIIFVAVIDSCSIIQRAVTCVCEEMNTGFIINVQGFMGLNDFFEYPEVKKFNIVIYDVLSCNEWCIDPIEDIFAVRSVCPGIRICIFSAINEFMTLTMADGTLDKRAPLADVRRFICQSLSGSLPRAKRHHRSVLHNSYRLTKWQASVIRGYMANCHTKEIAKRLNCSSRQVYAIREKAFRQIKQYGCGENIYRCIGRLASGLDHPSQ